MERNFQILLFDVINIKFGLFGFSFYDDVFGAVIVPLTYMDTSL